MPVPWHQWLVRPRVSQLDCTLHVEGSTSTPAKPTMALIRTSDLSASTICPTRDLMTYIDGLIVPFIALRHRQLQSTLTVEVERANV